MKRGTLASALMLSALAATGAVRLEPKPIADIPFESLKHQIIVEVTLGGRGPYTMLLDTGTDPSGIDAALARRLRPPADTTLHAGTGAGSEPIRVFEWDMYALRLGAIRADTVAALGLDLAKLSERLGKPLDGVLGYSFLKGRVVQIDYRRHRVRFYRSAPPARAKEVAELAMEIDPEDPTPRFLAKVNGHDAMLLFDSGSSQALGVSGRAIQKLGLTEAFDVATPDSAFGYGGRAETRKGNVSSVEIGPIRFDEVPCAFGVKGFGENWEPASVAGKVGNALMEGMVVTLDYTRGQIRFER